MKDFKIVIQNSNYSKFIVNNFSAKVLFYASLFIHWFAYEKYCLCDDKMIVLTKVVLASLVVCVFWTEPGKI